MLASIFFGNKKRGLPSTQDSTNEGLKLGSGNPGKIPGILGPRGPAPDSKVFLSMSWIPCRHGRSFREVHLQRLKHFGRYEHLICCDAPHLLDSRSWKLEVKTLCPRVSLDEVLRFTYGETLRKLCTRFPWFRIHDMNSIEFISDRSSTRVQVLHFFNIFFGGSTEFN